jgi:hypothetical protein
MPRPRSDSPFSDFEIRGTPGPPDPEGEPGVSRGRDPAVPGPPPDPLPGAPPGWGLGPE